MSVKEFYVLECLECFGCSPELTAEELGQRVATGRWREVSISEYGEWCLTNDPLDPEIDDIDSDSVLDVATHHGTCAKCFAKRATESPAVQGKLF